jgi:pyruvate/2-oxoglutarate/acetoin dehydrogenase E1 component
MKARYAEALNKALIEEMDDDPTVLALGEDTALYGGVFQVTKGLMDRFGALRVVDTPISENGIVGAAVAMAMDGLRPVVELMYADFLPLALDSLSNGAAVFPYIYGDQVTCPIVVRTQGGAGASAGAQHSKMLEVIVAHIPGLRVVAPSSPGDAYQMLRAAIRCDEPVVFIEHKLLYNSRGELPEHPDPRSLAHASVLVSGSDVTIVSWSRHAQLALQAATVLAEHGCSAEVLDLRSLRPLDIETLAQSVGKTRRAVVVGESWLSYGPSAEIACRIYESVGSTLEGPVRRIGSREVPIPASPTLEAQVVPTVEDIVQATLEVWKGSLR